MSRSYLLGGGISKFDPYVHIVSRGKYGLKDRFFRKLMVNFCLLCATFCAFHLCDAKESDLNKIQIVAGKYKGFNNCTLIQSKMSINGNGIHVDRFLWNHNNSNSNSSQLVFTTTILTCRKKKKLKDDISDSMFSKTYLKMNIEEEFPVFVNLKSNENIEKAWIDAMIHRIRFLQDVLDEQRQEATFKRKKKYKDLEEMKLELSKEKISGVYLDLDFDRMNFPFDPNNVKKFLKRNTVNLVSSIKYFANELRKNSLELIISSTRHDEYQRANGKFETSVKNIKEDNEIESFHHIMPNTYDRDYLVYKIENTIKERDETAEITPFHKVHEHGKKMKKAYRQSKRDFNNVENDLSNISLLIISSGLKTAFLQDIIMSYFYDENSLLSRSTQSDLVGEILNKRLQNPRAKVLVFGLGYDSPLLYHASGGQITFVESNSTYIETAVTHGSSEKRIPENNIYYYPFADIDVAYSLQYLNEIYSISGDRDIKLHPNESVGENNSCESFLSCAYYQKRSGRNIVRQAKYLRESYDLDTLYHSNLINERIEKWDKLNSLSAGMDMDMDVDNSVHIETQEKLPLHIHNTILNFEKEFPVPMHLVQEGPFDIIIIDGPEGNDLIAPGRLLPIHWAAKDILRSPTSSSLIFVDDANREMEFKAVNLYYGGHEVWDEMDDLNENRSLLFKTTLPPSSGKLH